VSNVTVTLTANDDNSGVQYTKFKIDADEWMMYTSPFLVTEDGNHTLRFYSVDRSGNIEEEHTTSFIIQHHPLITLAITGGNGVSVLVENKGLLPLDKVSWHINLTGGILLKGASKEGLIPQLLPGQQKILSSSVLGFGKIIITVTVGETQATAQGFVLFIFILGVK
jgi:hypothetical protein